MPLSEAEVQALIVHAARARRCAHAPYSGYQVGAAVVGDDSRVFFGCNTENASYGLTLCAERAALAAGVCSGMRHARAIVVVTPDENPQAPCGACRQWLAELGGPDTEVIVATEAGARRTYVMADLLPDAFTLRKVEDADRKGNA